MKIFSKNGDGKLIKYKEIVNLEPYFILYNKAILWWIIVLDLKIKPTELLEVNLGYIFLNIVLVTSVTTEKHEWWF